MSMSYPILNMKATGRRIRKLREEHNISILELRNLLQLESVQAIYKWERGASAPSLDNLILLSRIFEVSIEAILVVEDEPTVQ